MSKVTVGSHWTWVSTPTSGTSLGAAYIGRDFVIDEVKGDRFRYHYADGTPGAWRVIAQLQHATGAKCDPGCSPALPCMETMCPGRRAECTGEFGFNCWAERQRQRREAGPATVTTPRPPELRCDREMVCGLYRVDHG